MTIRPTLPLALLLALCCLATAAAAQDAQALRARSLAATCAACHGTSGRGVEGSGIPALAGRPAATIEAQMKAFRSGDRPGTVMPQIARGYDDARIATIARVFAAEQRP